MYYISYNEMKYNKNKMKQMVNMGKEVRCMLYSD